MRIWLSATGVVFVMQYIRKIFHPTDLSEASEVAFLHALKLVVMCEGALTLLHVAGKHQHIHSSHFPSVRLTLERWGVIPHTRQLKPLTPCLLLKNRVWQPHIGCFYLPE